MMRRHFILKGLNILMSIDENDFINDDILGDGDGQRKPYVPKFEQDLQKAGGSLSALAEKKEAEKNNNLDELSSDVDLSSLRSEKVMSGPSDVLPKFEIEVEDLPEPDPEPVQNEPDEADIDFIYDDDGSSYSGSLDEISADSIVLDDMDVKLEEMRNDKSSMISSLKSQMMADDLAMSVEERPQLDDMSDEYAPSKKKEEDIIAKDKLDRDEKELIKTRLKNEIEAKPEGYNKKKSLEMYKKLMAEQKEKAAKHGFLMLMITAALGFVSALLIYILNSIAPEAKGLIPSLYMLAAGSFLFSLAMIIKSKFFKILSVLYFILNTIALIGPGLVVYAMTPENQQGESFIINTALYAAAIIFSAVTCFRLASNKDIEAYYEYKPEKSGKRR